jgi:hypothetical protein
MRAFLRGMCLAFNPAGVRERRRSRLWKLIEELQP